MNKENFNQKVVPVISILMIAFVTISICSANSFLYYFNDWVDLNWYITMGKGMLAGKIPYKDLFEQKGPIIYMIFSVICLFKNPYIAVYLLEIICAFLYLFSIFKISRRYLSIWWSIITCLIVSVVTYTSNGFVSGGGAVEEYCMPIFAYLLLCMLKFFEEGKQLSKKHAFIIGVLISFVFWLKFTLLMIVACYLIVYSFAMLKEKKYKNLFQQILYMIIGCIPLTVFIFTYFALNYAVVDLIQVYFYDNLFRYSSSINIGIIFVNILNNILVVTLLICGVVFGMKVLGKKHYPIALIEIFCLIILLITGLYVYYMLPLSSFSVFAIIFILKFLAKHNFNKALKISLSIILVLISIVYCVVFGNSTKEMFRPKESYAQFQVAEKIRSFKYENPTLLCYLMLDAGFYNASNIVPSTRFYAKNNFTEESYPEMYQAFDDSIDQKLVDFVVVEKKVFDRKKQFLCENYEYVDTYSYEYVENYIIEKSSYVLLKKI